MPCALKMSKCNYYIVVLGDIIISSLSRKSMGRTVPRPTAGQCTEASVLCVVLALVWSVMSLPVVIYYAAQVNVDLNITPPESLEPLENSRDQG